MGPGLASSCPKGSRKKLGKRKQGVDGKSQDPGRLVLRLRRQNSTKAQPWGARRQHASEDRLCAGGAGVGG